jgi:hypothetical protein
MGVASGAGGAAGGLNLLTGLRAAEDARAAGGARAANVAAQESARATSALHNDELARRQGIMELAGAAANIFPTLAATQLASKDQGPTNEPAARVSPEEVGADPSLLSQFFDENPIPDAALQSPFLDAMDAQDKADLDEAYANDFEDNVAQPGETANPPTQQDVANSAIDGDDQAFEQAGTKDDPVANQVYQVTQTPSYRSLIDAGHSHLEALQAINPELARAAAIQAQRQYGGTGTGMTLQGPQ